MAPDAHLCYTRCGCDLLRHVDDRNHLRAGGAQPELRLVDDKDRGTVCQNLTEIVADSPAEVFRLLQLAEARSRVASTRMNKQSK